MSAEAYLPLRRPNTPRQFYGGNGMRMNFTLPIGEELRTEFGIIYEGTKRLTRVAIPLAATIFLGYSAEASAQGPKGAPVSSFPVCETGIVIAGFAALAFLHSRRSGKKQEQKEEGGIATGVDIFTSEAFIKIKDNTGASITISHNLQTDQDSIKFTGPKKPQSKKK